MRFIFMCALLLTYGCSITKHRSTSTENLFHVERLKNRTDTLFEDNGIPPICLPEGYKLKEGQITFTGPSFNKIEILKALYLKQAQLHITNHLSKNKRIVVVSGVTNEEIELDTYYCFVNNRLLLDINGTDLLYVTYVLRKE